MRLRLSILLWLSALNIQADSIFEKRCSGCHSPDKNKEGPRLRGVYGRPAARSDFPYSDALKNARLKWDDATLDKWLQDTDALVSGNDMNFRMTDAKDRAAVIAYLKSLF